LDPDSRFCPSCGAPVDRARAKGEKSEKEERREKEEKEEKGEKQEKHEKHEKHEKAEGDRSGALIGGLIIILLGVVLILRDQGILAEGRVWASFLLGIGVILLASAAWRYHSGFRGMATGQLIGGLVLCSIGGGGLLGFEDWLAFLLIAGGVIIIFMAFSASKRNPRPP